MRFGILLSLAIVPVAEAALAQERTIASFPPISKGNTVYPTGLTAEANGNLVGTGVYPAGAILSKRCRDPNGCGNVFEVSPPRQGGAWAFNTVYSFMDGADGGFPVGPFAIGADGALYGVAQRGGTGKSNCFGGAGTAWVLKPGAGGYTLSVLYQFGPEGVCSADGGLALLSDGTLIGSTQSSIYALTPGQQGYTFQSIPLPQTYQTIALGNLRAINGTVFGVAWRGPGKCDCGFVYRITRNPQGVWSFTDIYDFTGGTDGFDPFGPILSDSTGNIYGSTVAGGPNGYGTVFELSPPQGGAGQWIFVNSLEFGANTVGHPSNIVLDPSNGVIYGAGGGGHDGFPTGDLAGVFSIVPQGNTWTYTTLHSDGAHCAVSQGGCLDGGLALGFGGQLYGLAGGGANKDGRIYQVKIR